MPPGPPALPTGVRVMITCDQWHDVVPVTGTIPCRDCLLTLSRTVQRQSLLLIELEQRLRVLEGIDAPGSGGSDQTPPAP